MCNKENTWQIVFAGVGGQGLVLNGFLLGEAASIAEKKQVTMVMSYGSETRGTFTKTEVIISDAPIAFPEVITPRVVVALAQVAYDRYAANMTEGSILIYDSDSVCPANSAAKQYGYPISKIASEAGGLMTTNLTAMGVLVRITELVSADSVIYAIEKRFSENPVLIEKNVKSFKCGMDAVSEGLH